MSEPIDSRVSAGTWPPGQAPRITKERIESIVKNTEFVVMPDGRTTICELTLENGFTVRGESSCVFAENFDAETGRDIAYQQAFNKVWQLEGYLLAQHHYLERLRLENGG